MSLLTLPFRLIAKPFRAVGRLIARLLRRAWRLLKLAALFTIVVMLLDALFNRDGEDDDEDDA